jgi:hypothetical protein
LKEFWANAHLRGVFKKKQVRAGTSRLLIKKRSEGCFVWAAPSLLLAPYQLNNCPFQLSVSWESNPARVIAREKEKYLVQIVKIFSSLEEIRKLDPVD